MSDTSHRFPNREGQRVPDVSLRLRRNGEWATVTSADLFANKNVVVFRPARSRRPARRPICPATTSSRRHSSRRDRRYRLASRSTIRS
jgi:hypothetical protein